MEFLDKRVAELNVMSASKETDVIDIEEIIIQFEENEFRFNQRSMQVETQLVFEDLLKVYIPEKFVRSSLMEAKIKYPSEQRPQLIYRNTRDTINIGFSLIEQTVPDEHIVDMKDVMRDAYLQVNPVSNILDQGLEIIGDRPLAYYTFDSFAIGGQIYNCVFITRLNDYLLIGTMNGAKKDMRMCKPLFYGVMHTLEFLDEEVSDNE